MFDVVYLWVDGNDPLHQEARRRALGHHVVSESVGGAHRFRSNDELKYSLRSLERFAPWVQRIFVVTSLGQQPSWLKVDDQRVHVVHDRDIFPNSIHLPTFNSCALERQLHRIPELKHPFLYLNDDMLLGRPVDPGEFIRADGTFRCLVGDVTVESASNDEMTSETSLQVRMPEVLQKTYVQSLFYSHALLSQRYGERPRRIPPHTPTLMHGRILQDFEGLWPQEVEMTSASKFRKPDNIQFQFTWTHHVLEEARLRKKLGHDAELYRAEEVVLPWPQDDVHCSVDYAMASLGDSTFRKSLRKIHELRPKFICLQDGAQATEEEFASVRELLKTFFPKPSAFELESL